MKLAVGIPSSGRPVPVDWALGMMDLQFPRGCAHARICAKAPNNRQGGRTAIVKQARKLGCEYLFFVDDDTLPPPSAINWLLPELETRDDAVICAGIYCLRADPPTPLVFKEALGGPYWRWKHGDIFECDAIGTGCMLIRMSVFGQLSEPWFCDIDSSDDPNLPASASDFDSVTMSDDMFFCRKVREAGHQILAHGKVLAIHYDPNGRPFVLDPTSYPMRDTDPTQLWYARQRGA